MQERKPRQGNAHVKKSAKLKADIALSEKSTLSKEEQKRLNNELINAVQVGDNDKLKRLIKAGANFATKDDRGWTALHRAAEDGRTETCALLMEEYTKSGGHVKEFIAAKDNADRTALHFAAWYGHTQTCIMLIYEYAKSGGDIKKFIFTTDKKGETALQKAASYGRTKTVQFLKLIEWLADMTGNAFMKSFYDCVA